MNRSIRTVLSLLLVAAPVAACTPAAQRPVIVHAGGAERQTGLTVTGSATIGVSPDCLDLTLTVAHEHRDPANAIAAVQERQAALVAVLRELDIAQADLTLSSLAVDPVYDWTDNRTVLRGFEARTTITATTRRFDQIGALMAASAKAGATQMSSRFRRSDLESLRSKVRADAIAAAQAKAKETASALGVSLAAITTVAESNHSALFGNEYFAPPAADGGGLGGDLQPLTVDVTITYALAS